MIDTIIEIVDEKAKEDQEEIAAKSQFKMKINEFLSQFWEPSLVLQYVIWGILCNQIGLWMRL